MPMPITVKKVESRRDLRAFVKFPLKLYRNCPYYVPNLYMDEMSTLDMSKNPMGKYSKCEKFLAYNEKGEIVGRVAAIINEIANRDWNHAEVRFGWMDFIDDKAVSKALLEAVIAFGRKHGMTQVTGPLGFTDFDNEGCVVEGFDDISSFMLKYNYPYYGEHFEALGMSKVNDWLEYRIYVPEQVPEKVTKAAALVSARYGLHVRKITKREVVKENYGQKIFDLVNRSYCELFDFTVLPPEVIDQYIKTYLGLLDLNYAEITPYDNMIVMITSTPMEEAVTKLVNNVLPTLTIYVAMTVVSIWVTNTGLSMIRERTALAESTAAMEHELNIASDIQLGMLPDDFPDTDSYSIKAVMRPAKDVGGDFYDFVRIGVSQVAFLVADVSGKGVPAALFMASARTLIRSNLKNGMSADAVMDRTNSELIQTNREKLFVTAWLGILDLSTGSLSYVNAGHNPPFVIHADGTAENVVSRPNFVLGRKKGIRYREHRMALSPGDRLFLYTDGLTDSTDAGGHMYGIGRVKEMLSSGKATEDIIPSMMDSVDRFSRGTEQFDDITMLLVDFRRLKTVEHSAGECFPANPEGHDRALGYIRGRLSEGGCSDKALKDIEISASEILSNIDMYAYEGRDDGTVRISADVIDRMATVVFVDDGPEYNPLERSSPDVEKRIREHKIGGFGIFIVRKLMDDVRYERSGDRNILTITKEI